MGLVRFLLAVTVVCAHVVGDAMVGGQYAVQLFFLISGYLISYVLVEAKTYSRVRDFYINRGLRILPLYYLVAALSLLALLSRGGGSSVFHTYSEMPLTAKIIVGLTNLTLIGQDQVMFLSVTDGVLSWTGDYQSSDVPLFAGLLVPQAWTLSLELMFYLIAPWILVSKSRIMVLFAVSVLLRALFVVFGFGLADPWDYRFFPTELAFFLFGAISHQFVAPKLIWARKHRAPLLSAVAVTVMSGLIVSFAHIPLPEALKFAVLFGGMALFLPLLFDFQGNNSIDNFLGQLSYPIYIWHILVVSVWMTLTSGFDFSTETDLAGILACTLGVSWIGLRLVEDPIQKIRSQFRATGR